MEYHKSAFVLWLLFLFVENKTVLGFKNTNVNEFYPQLSKSCPEEGFIEIKGYDVRFSDFVRSNGDIYSLCSYNSDLNVIKVFALNTLVIDRDLGVAGSHLKLFFVAPKWFVIGDRRITVDGKMGKYKPRAKSGDSSNTTGADGEPGDPGGPGGNFIGIGETFVNGHRLVITANGGTGGTGQYGGNGYDAATARSADRRSIEKMSCEECSLKCNEDHHQLNLKDNAGDYNSFTCKSSFEEKKFKRCTCKIFGWKGEDGGKGGNGGRGGIGGLPGSVKLVALNNDSHRISTYGIPGERGVNGVGGVGGKSGQNGHNVIYTDSDIYPPKIEHEQGQITFYRLGPNGSDGYNSVGYKEDRVAPDVLEPLEIEHVLTEHKIWLRGISGLAMNDKALVMFYKDLYDNSVLTSLHKVSYLLKEIKDIDEHYIIKLPRYGHKLMPFYDSALGRVYGFAETFEYNTTQDQDKKIRFLVYTNLIGRLNNYTLQPDTYLDWKLGELSIYDERRELEKIYDLLIQRNSYGVIINQKYYQNQIDTLTHSSKWYSTNKMNIQDLKIYVDNTMGKLMGTILKAKKEPKTPKQWIIERCKDLQVLMLFTSYLTSIDLIKALFDTLYVLVESVGSVVKNGGVVQESLIIGKTNVTKPSVLPRLLHKLNSSINAFKSKEITRMNELLKNIQQKTSSIPEILTDVYEQLLIIQLKLQSTNRFYAIIALRSDLLKSLKIKMEELSDYVSVQKKFKRSSQVAKSRRAHSVLNRIITLTTLSGGFIDLFNKFSHDNSNLDTIVECIDNSNHSITVTTSYENRIFELIYPLLQSIQDMIMDTSENPEHFSKLVFLFTKQELRFGLLRIKQSIRHLAGTTRVNGVVIEVLKVSGGVCTALIAIFDRLQSYLHLRELTDNVIPDASSPVKMGALFTDVLMSNGFGFIKNHLGFILALKHYKNFVESFKNFVFPFAHLYFKNLILPEHFSIYDNSFAFIYYAVSTQMDLIVKQVEEYKSMMLRGEYVAKKHYGSQGSHKKFKEKPFFVWRNAQYEGAILKLLSGEKVVFTSDITNSTLTDNAIKLKYMDFYFKAKDETTQKRIDDVFLYFWINAEHSGNSQYRYDNHIYVTTSQSVKVSYSFEIDENGDRIGYSASYTSLKNANIMLSPYTSWKLSIQEAYPGNNITFKDLMVFKNDVDIELGGYGYYISKVLFDSNKHLVNVEKYYKPIGNL